MPTTTDFRKHGTDLGSYWTSTATRTALRGRLVGAAATRLKTAEEDGSGEFEQAFSSLAYTYIKERAPRLLDFIVGFQLVDRNEDKTKAVGLFGFKVGDEWIYAPTFFLNGNLKGHELQYLKSQDAFVPLKENWVNFIISRKPHKLGEPSPQDTRQLGGRMPNLRRLALPPIGSKYGGDRGADGGLHVDAWARPALPLLAALATRQGRGLYPELTKAAALDFAAVAASPLAAALAPTAAVFDLRAALQDFGLLKAAYEQCYLRYPLIKAGFDRFYGPDFFAEVGAAARDRRAADARDLVKRAASYVLPPRRPKRPLRKPGRPLRLVEEPAPAEREDPLKSGALRIYVHDAVDGPRRLGKRAETMTTDDDAVLVQNRAELDEAERERLLRDTVLIKDERRESEKSIAYDTQVATALVNPGETGLYQVLEKPGTFDRMLVVAAPYTGAGRQPFATVVRVGDPRAWLNARSSAVWTRQTDQPEPREFADWFEGLAARESLDVGSTYLALDYCGSGTCPFTVKESYGDGAYRVAWEDHCRDKHGDSAMGWNEGPRLPVAGYVPGDYTPWDAKIWVGKRGGGAVRTFNGELWIPQGFKFLKLREPDHGDDVGPLLRGCGCCSQLVEGAGSKPRPIQPGNLIDVQLILTEKRAAGDLAAVRLHEVGADEVAVRSRGVVERMSKKAALIGLVRDHGLSEAQARAMLKAAGAAGRRHAAVEYLVKYADAYGYGGLQPGPNAPVFPEPQYGFEQYGSTGYPTIEYQEEFEPVPELDAALTDPAVYDPFHVPDEQAMQQAQQAAQSGQKEVFDVSMVSGLLKSVRQDSLVDRYLGALMKALDKLGRILFMFFWHQEEFADRYGKGELPELEDSLRNAFEALGDVCLYLKERTVQGGLGMGGDQGDSSPTDSAEPNIVETARN